MYPTVEITCGLRAELVLAPNLTHDWAKNSKTQQDLGRLLGVFFSYVFTFAKFT